MENKNFRMVDSCASCKHMIKTRNFSRDLRCGLDNQLVGFDDAGRKGTVWTCDFYEAKRKDDSEET